MIINKAGSLEESTSYYRFINNPRVTEKELIASVIGNCVESCKGVGHVLVACDTTEANVNKHRNRIKDKNGLGLTGNNKDLGFFAHPCLVMNALDGSIIGLSDLHLWHRKESKANKFIRNYHQLPFHAKESYRWSNCGIKSHDRLKAAGVKGVTLVQDREGDIYESFCMLKGRGVDFVIRSNHNRNLNEGEKLQEYISGLSPVFEYELEVKGDNKKRTKRKAKMEVRYAQVEICRPSNLKNKTKYPSALQFNYVRVKEKAESVPEGESAIEWDLYTTHEVRTEEDALRIIGYYKYRWTIEEVFRVVKSEGLDYESSELESGSGLRKLFVLALTAVIQILQMKQARDGSTTQATSIIFNKEECEYLEKVNLKVEGKTQLQKNPYEKQNLAWATWIIARLGGWKGYAKQRPPGVITLRNGLARFHAMFDGWRI